MNISNRILIYLDVCLLMIAALSITRGFGIVIIPLLKNQHFSSITTFMLLPATYQLGHVLIGSPFSVWIDKYHKQSLLVGLLLISIGLCLSFLYINNFYVLIPTFLMISIGMELLQNGVWSTLLKTTSFGRIWDVLPASLSSALSPILLGFIFLSGKDLFLVILIIIIITSPILLSLVHNKTYAVHRRNNPWYIELKSLIKEDGFRRLLLLNTTTFSAITLLITTFSLVMIKNGISGRNIIITYITYFALVTLAFRFITTYLSYFIFDIRKIMGFSSIILAIGLVFFTYNYKLGLVISAIGVSFGAGAVHTYVSDRWGQENIFTIMGHNKTINGIFCFCYLMTFGIIYDITKSFTIFYICASICLFISAIYFLLEKNIIYSNKLNGSDRNGNNIY